MKIKKEYMGYVMNLISFIYYYLIYYVFPLENDFVFGFSCVIALVILGLSIYYLRFSKYKIVNLICIIFYSIYVILNLIFAILVRINYATM